jgi:hypothetical protein
MSSIINNILGSESTGVTFLASRKPPTINIVVFTNDAVGLRNTDKIVGCVFDRIIYPEHRQTKWRW